MQRPVLYLGEIKDSQQAAWRKTRSFGDCWLGCELWRQLELDKFWSDKLTLGRETVAWSDVFQLLAVNRLIDPGSDFRLHRQWFGQSAMGELPGADEDVAGKVRLYRCLDRLLPHKQDLFIFLRQRWHEMFNARFDILLYDLTSTYRESQTEGIPSAKRGYSRGKRPDCLPLVIALVVTPDGFTLAYEVMDGNRSDKTTLHEFLVKIETMYGKAERVWVMDRGIPAEAVLEEMRKAESLVFYLVGTPRVRMRKMERDWLDLPWRKVRDSEEVKLAGADGEMYVLAKSEGRQAKEMAMRRSCPSRDQLLLRIGAAKSAAGRASGFVEITWPKAGEAVTRERFTFRVLMKDTLRETELRDGHYLLW